ncbi:hypothetical protein [Actinokineospora enzanensis]|uniref:hypothetical protein n=1 Tax=Actinokineospora enzanensis TaxID=155975 RepID=UPI00035D32B0|nr:hypothetical protein [Actinokineospora enzanensis]
MSKLLQKAAIAVGAAAAAVAFASAPASAFTGRFIYVDTLAACQDGGNNGVANGVFASYTCDSGFGGYSLHALPTATSFNDVFVHLFSSDTACNAAGNNGVPTPGELTEWNSYRCLSGFGGWSLRVTG